MALGSHIEMSGRAGRRGAFQVALALLLAAAAHISNASAASPELMRPSPDCHQITVGGSTQPVAVPLWRWPHGVRHDPFQ
jgi:hypothetical protein